MYNQNSRLQQRPLFFCSGLAKQADNKVVKLRLCLIPEHQKLLLLIPPPIYLLPSQVLPNSAKLCSKQYLSMSTMIKYTYLQQ